MIVSYKVTVKLNISLKDLYNYLPILLSIKDYWLSKLTFVCSSYFQDNSFSEKTLKLIFS